MQTRNERNFSLILNNSCIKKFLRVRKLFVKNLEIIYCTLTCFSGNVLMTLEM